MVLNCSFSVQKVKITVGAWNLVAVKWITGYMIPQDYAMGLGNVDIKKNLVIEVITLKRLKGSVTN